MDGLNQNCAELDRNKVDQDDYDKEVHNLKEMIKALGEGKPVQIEAAPSGPRISDQDVERWNIAAATTDLQSKELQDMKHEMKAIPVLKSNIDQINQKLLDFVTHE